jgi:hypothetical protein
MPTHEDHPSRESHVHNFELMTPSGYTIAGSVEIVLKTQIQPVPPKPVFRKTHGQDHWQVTSVNNEELMVLQYVAEIR